MSTVRSKTDFPHQDIPLVAPPNPYAHLGDIFLSLPHSWHNSRELAFQGRVTLIVQGAFSQAPGASVEAKGTLRIVAEKIGNRLASLISGTAVELGTREIENRAGTVRGPQIFVEALQNMQLTVGKWTRDKSGFVQIHGGEFHGGVKVNADAGVKIEQVEIQGQNLPIKVESRGSIYIAKVALHKGAELELSAPHLFLNASCFKMEGPFIAKGGLLFYDDVDIVSVGGTVTNRAGGSALFTDCHFEGREVQNTSAGVLCAWRVKAVAKDLIKQIANRLEESFCSQIAGKRIVLKGTSRLYLLGGDLTTQSVRVESDGWVEAYDLDAKGLERLRLEGKKGVRAPCASLLSKAGKVSAPSGSVDLAHANLAGGTFTIGALTEINAHFIEGKLAGRFELNAPVGTVHISEANVTAPLGVHTDAHTVREVRSTFDAQAGRVSAHARQALYSEEMERKAKIVDLDSEGWALILGDRTEAQKISRRAQVLKVHKVKDEALLFGRLQGKRIDGTHLQLNGGDWVIVGGELWLPAAKIEGVTMRVDGTDYVDLTRAHIDVEQAFVQAGKLWAPAAWMRAKHEIDIAAMTRMSLQKAELSAEMLAVQGDTLHGDKMEVSGRTAIFMTMEHILSLRKAKAGVYERMALSGRILDARGAHMRADSSMLRATEVLRVAAESVSRLHEIEGGVVDQHGAYQLQTERATIAAGFVMTDAQTVREGRGDLQISSGEWYADRGTNQIDGTIKMQAPEVLLGGQTETRELVVTASQKNLMVDGAAHVSRLMKLSARSLINEGALRSEGVLAIHQRDFVDVGNASAAELLRLSADGTIALKQPRIYKSNLEFHSVEGGISITKPLRVIGSAAFSAPKGALAIVATHVQVTGDTRIDVARLLFLARIGQGVQRAFAEFQGNLAVRVTLQALNSGSVVDVGGHVDWQGAALANKNIYRYETRVETQKVKIKRKWRKSKKRRLHHQIVERHTVADALIRVRGDLGGKMYGTLDNDGVVSAQNFALTVDWVVNGLASNYGRTQHAVGLLHAVAKMALTVRYQLYNLGILKAQKLLLDGSGTLLVERRTVVEMREGLKVKRWGRTRKKQCVVDHLEPGGQVIADVIDSSMSRIVVRGGEILTTGDIKVDGQDFIEEPKRVRTLHHVNLGKVSPFRKGNGYSMRLQIEPARVISGANAILNLTNLFHITASHLLALLNVRVTAGKILLDTAFTSYCAARKRKCAKSRDLYAIEAVPPMIRAILLDVFLKTIRDSIEMNGGVVAAGRDVNLISVQDIVEKAVSHYVKHRTKGWKCRGVSVAHSDVRFSTAHTVSPLILAGRDVRKLVPNGIIDLEGVIEIAGRDSHWAALAIRDVAHQVKTWASSSTTTIGLNFPGSNFISNPSTTTLLREDQSLAALKDLIRAKGIGIPIQSVMTIATTLSEALQIYNTGTPGVTLGISARIGYSEMTQTPTQSIGSLYTARRDMFRMTTYDQWYEGTRMSAGSLAHFQGRNLTLTPAVDTNKSRQWGAGVSVGIGLNCCMVSADASYAQAKQIQVHPVQIKAARTVQRFASIDNITRKAKQTALNLSASGGSTNAFSFADNRTRFSVNTAPLEHLYDLYQEAQTPSPEPVEIIEEEVVELPLKPLPESEPEPEPESAPHPPLSPPRPRPAPTQPKEVEKRREPPVVERSCVERAEQHPPSRLEEIKSEELLSIQLGMIGDAEGVGKLGLLLKPVPAGLTEAEARELRQWRQDIADGAMAAQPAAFFAVVHKTLEAATQGMYLAGVNVLCFKVNPNPFLHTACVTEVRDIVEGRHPLTEDVVAHVGKFFAALDKPFQDFDAYSQQKHGTPPGLMHDGALGVIDVALTFAGDFGIRRALSWLKPKTTAPAPMPKRIYTSTEAEFVPSLGSVQAFERYTQTALEQSLETTRRGEVLNRMASNEALMRRHIEDSGRVFAEVVEHSVNKINPYEFNAHLYAKRTPFITDLRRAVTPRFREDLGYCSGATLYFTKKWYQHRNIDVLAQEFSAGVPFEGTMLHSISQDAHLARLPDPLTRAARVADLHFSPYIEVPPHALDSYVARKPHDHVTAIFYESLETGWHMIVAAKQNKHTFVYDPNLGLGVSHAKTLEYVSRLFPVHKTYIAEVLPNTVGLGSHTFSSPPQVPGARSPMGMSGKDMIKAYKQRGYEVVRIKGSHHTLKKGNRTQTISYSRKELPTGLQRKFWRDLLKEDSGCITLGKKTYDKISVNGSELLGSKVANALKLKHLVTPKLLRHDPKKNLCKMQFMEGIALKTLFARLGKMQPGAGREAQLQKLSDALYATGKGIAELHDPAHIEKVEHLRSDLAFVPSSDYEPILYVYLRHFRTLMEKSSRELFLPDIDIDAHLLTTLTEESRSALAKGRSVNLEPHFPHHYLWDALSQRVARVDLKYPVVGYTVEDFYAVYAAFTEEMIVSGLTRGERIALSKKFVQGYATLKDPTPILEDVSFRFLAEVEVITRTLDRIHNKGNAPHIVKEIKGQIRELNTTIRSLRKRYQLKAAPSVGSKQALEEYMHEALSRNPFQYSGSLAESSRALLPGHANHVFTKKVLGRSFAALRVDHRRAHLFLQRTPFMTRRFVEASPIVTDLRSGYAFGSVLNFAKQWYGGKKIRQFATEITHGVPFDSALYEYLYSAYARDNASWAPSNIRMDELGLRFSEVISLPANALFQHIAKQPEGVVMMIRLRMMGSEQVHAIAAMHWKKRIIAYDVNYGIGQLKSFNTLLRRYPSVYRITVSQITPTQPLALLDRNSEALLKKASRPAQTPPNRQTSKKAWIEAVKAFLQDTT